MEDFLRSWRQDALNKGQLESAIYIGDKVLALTSQTAILTPNWCILLAWILTLECARRQ
jgi:hypothetical protein